MKEISETYKEMNPSTILFQEQIEDILFKEFLYWKSNLYNDKTSI